MADELILHVVLRRLTSRKYLMMQRLSKCVAGRGLGNPVPCNAVRADGVLLVPHMGMVAACFPWSEDKTTRTFEHRGEAWRVLVSTKIVVSCETAKCFLESLALM